MIKHNLCCHVSEECWHNSTPERINEIIAEKKAERDELEKEWVKHLPPFDMQEWYKRIKS